MIGRQTRRGQIEIELALISVLEAWRRSRQEIHRERRCKREEKKVAAPRRKCPRGGKDVYLSWMSA